MKKPHEMIIGGVMYVLLFIGSHARLEHKDTDDKCGGEDRWDQKIMTDQAAKEVTLNPKPTTIEALATFKTKAKIGRHTERLPEERQVYKIKDVFITKAILQKDNDIHLIVEDGKGHSVLIEIPDPSCSQARTSKFAGKFKEARDVFMQYQNTYDQFLFEVTGVLFVDAPHPKSPLGNNPNNVELHPVLSLKKIKRINPKSI